MRERCSEASTQQQAPRVNLGQVYESAVESVTGLQATISLLVKEVRRLSAENQQLAQRVAELNPQPKEEMANGTDKH